VYPGAVTRIKKHFQTDGTPMLHILALVIITVTLCSCHSVTGAWITSQEKSVIGGQLHTVRIRGLGVTNTEGDRSVVIGYQEQQLLYSNDLNDLSGAPFKRCRGLYTSLPKGAPIHTETRATGFKLGLTRTFWGLEAGRQHRTVSALPQNSSMSLRIKTDSRNQIPPTKHYSIETQTKKTIP
jgi:hypothetical protein